MKPLYKISAILIVIYISLNTFTLKAQEWSGGDNTNYSSIYRVGSVSIGGGVSPLNNLQF